MFPGPATPIDDLDLRRPRVPVRAARSAVATSRSAMWRGRFATSAATRRVDDLAAFEQLQPREPRRRLDRDGEAPAAGRIEARTAPACASTRGPSRFTTGRNTRCRKSNGGAHGLCVPPSSVSVDRPRASSSGGSTVCSTSVALPAVRPKTRSPRPRPSRGVKVSARESERVALDVRIADRGRRLDCGQVLTQQAGLAAGRRECARCGTAARSRSTAPSAVRSTCPPPSPLDPSIVIIARHPPTACTRRSPAPGAAPVHADAGVCRAGRRSLATVQ